MRAIDILRQQQAQQKEGTPAWCVAEQLIELCEREPASAELLAHDLENDSMSIVEAEKKIKALADECKKKVGGSCVAISPREAEQVLREFYGLPMPEERASAESGKTLNLLDFLR